MATDKKQQKDNEMRWNAVAAFLASPGGFISRKQADKKIEQARASAIITEADIDKLQEFIYKLTMDNPEKQEQIDADRETLEQFLHQQIHLKLEAEIRADERASALDDVEKRLNKLVLNWQSEEGAVIEDGSHLRTDEHEQQIKEALDAARRAASPSNSADLKTAKRKVISDE